jgi:hypothetical protein
MTRLYTYTTNLEWTDSNDTVTGCLDDVVVTYAVAWPEPGLGLNHAWVPPCDITVESIDGTPWAEVDGGYGGREALLDTIQFALEMDHQEAMIEHAAELEGDWEAERLDRDAERSEYEA